MELYKFPELIREEEIGEVFKLKDKIVKNHLEKCCKELGKYILEHVIPNMCKDCTFVIRNVHNAITEFRKSFQFYCSCGKKLGELNLNFEINVR